MGNEPEHPYERWHSLANLLHLHCTACSHATNYHYKVGYGVWKCEYCGRKCYAIKNLFDLYG